MSGEASAESERAESPPAGEHHHIADLRRFFGPNAEYFLKFYYETRFANPGKKNFLTGLNWHAAIFGFLWLFYRKLYVAGAALIAFAFVVSWVLPAFVDLPGNLSIPIWICVGLYATSYYVDRAEKFVRQADTAGLQGETRNAFLERSGGVSITGAALGGAAVAAMVVLVVKLPHLSPRLPACDSADARKGLEEILRKARPGSGIPAKPFIIGTMSATVLRDNSRTCSAEIRVEGATTVTMTYEIFWLDRGRGVFQISAWRSH